MREVAVCFLILLFSVQVADARPSCDTDFGTNIEDVTELRRIEAKLDENYFKGDINGDRIEDRIRILKFDNTAKFNKDVMLINPVTYYLKAKAHPGGKFVLPEKSAYAIGVIQSNGSDNECQKFVFYNTYFFPYSDNYRLGARVIRADDEGYAFLYKENLTTDKLKFDLISLLAGGGMGLLYWNGKEFKFELPFLNPEDEDKPF